MTQTAASIQDMAHHLHPFSDNKQLKESGVRIIEKADGIYIYDNQGNKIIDGTSATVAKNWVKSPKTKWTNWLTTTPSSKPHTLP